MIEKRYTKFPALSHAVNKVIIIRRKLCFPVTKRKSRQRCQRETVVPGKEGQGNPGRVEEQYSESVPK